MKQFFKNYLNQDHDFDRVTLLGIFSYMIVITGIFGWIYEFIFYYLNSGMTQFYFRGGNFLPWINIYAIGAMFIYFFTYKKRKNPFFIFIVSFITCGILDYIAGWGMYEFGSGLRCWDYNSEIWNFGNINGYVCLRSVTFFGISSLLLMYGVVPFCFYLAKTMNRKLFLTIGFTICFIFLFDELYNLIFARLLSLPRASTIYKKIGFHYIYF